MNRTIHPFPRLAALVTTVLGMVLVTAAQAAARQPPPGPGERTGNYSGPSTTSVHQVTEAPVSALSWGLLAAAVLGALVVGAALMHLAQRRRAQLAH